MTDMIEEKTITKELEVKLTHVEMADKAQAAGGLQAEIRAANDDFNAVKKEHNAHINRLQERLSSILTICEARKEKRMVECIERKNFAQAAVEYIYNDEVVETRPMEGHELQKDMFDDNRKFAKAEEVEATEEAAAVPIDEQIAADIRESTSHATASSAVQ